MNSTPLLSVVMSVVNDEKYIENTIVSVLSQNDVDLEFIVINDGSTDRTGEILDRFASSDSRLRVIHQTNSGLTRSLVRGCDAARGKYIARQDAGGDISLPGRFRKQVDHLEANPSIIMNSCGTEFLGPGGETLYQVKQYGDQLQRGLQRLAPDKVAGPSSHPSAVFQRTAYYTVGQYRPVFPVAQDLDLWIRMAELGQCSAIPEVLYQVRLFPESISSMKKNRQREATRVIVECAKLRKAGQDEAPVLDRYGQSLERRPEENRFSGALQRARFYYFLGSVIRKERPKEARRYFLKSIKSFYLYPRALCRLLF